jgi:hypothetical protein
MDVYYSGAANFSLHIHTYGKPKHAWMRIIAVPQTSAPYNKAAHHAHY